jgi:cytochrome c peroxidase
MHDGAFNTLEATVLHHLDPASSLRQYDPGSQLPPELQSTYQGDEDLIEQMLANLDPRLAESKAISDEQVAELIAFLESLTDPAITELDAVVPGNVPSGLPVAD